jgi:hypothetical protein
MRFLQLPGAALLSATLFLAACSEPAAETKPKEPEKPLEPVTGRQAFQATYPAARAWASDCEPLRIRSLNLTEVPAGDGKAGAWEITYTSRMRGMARVYTWSAVEAEGNLHKGVFATQPQTWREGGQERPFPAAALKVDTSEALEKAREESSEYLARPGQKPPVTFLLEYTPRFPDPTWRVLWGLSVGSAERQVFIDATTGDTVGRQ